MKKPEYFMIGSVQFDKNALPKREVAFDMLRNVHPFVHLDNAEEEVNKAIDESGFFPSKKDKKPSEETKL